MHCNCAKYIISLQKRFALGLLNGLIVHLKFKGLWDLYKLIEPLLKNIKVKDYQTLLKEVSFPEYQLNFLKHLICCLLLRLILLA